MPQKWMRCPDPTNPLRDERDRVETDDCLACSQNRPERECPWTFPVLSYMVSVERDYLSPTSLQRCPREVFLRHASDYAVDPKKAWARTRGTLSHGGLEKYPEGLTEISLQRSIVVDGQTYVMRGTADNVILAQRKIRDWKTTGKIADLKRYGALPKADHVEQVSVYGWMGAGNELTPQHLLDGIPGFVKPWSLDKVHRLMEVFGLTSYDEPYRFEADRGEIVYIDPKDQERQEFDLWTLEAVEKLIGLRLPMIARMMQQGMAVDAWRKEGGVGTAPDEMTQDIPGVLPNEEQWRCGYCDVHDQCSILAKRQGIEPANPRRRRSAPAKGQN